MLQSISHRRISCLVAVAVACWSAATFAAVPPPVGEHDQIEFDQRRAAAHMRELEGRLYRLAEVIRDAEPDHAARLMLGLERARQELIVEQMAEIRKLLNAQQIDGAVRAEKDVLRKLEELRELLLSTDLDLLLKLDRLRRLDEALKTLEKITREQERQHGLVKDLDRDGPRDDAPPFDQLQEDQQRNRSATDDLRNKVRRATEPGSPAPGELGAASGSMGKAQSSLGQGKPSGAAGEQEDAIERLERAREALEEERQKLIEQLRSQVRAKVNEALKEMLEGEEKIREATERLVPAVKADPATTGAAAARLATRQRALASVADRTIELIVETEFGIALPVALRAIERQMNVVGDDLAQGTVSEAIVYREQRIEKELAALIEWMNEQPSLASEPREGKPSKGGCKSCGDRNKLTAELKMVRMLQANVRRDTVNVDDRREGRAVEPGTRIYRSISDLEQRQVEIQDAVERLGRQSCARCATEPNLRDE